LRPTHPGDQADQCEYAGDDQEGPSAALRVADPEERHEKGVPNESAGEAAEHGVESGKADAFRAPVKIEEPRLARSFCGFASVNSLADYAANAVDKEEEAGGEKHGAKDGDEPERRVLSSLDDVEGGETDEDSGDHEGQAEECGGAAVDGGGALGGVVWESGRQAGAAAEHALFDGCGGFGGESDRHGTCLRSECLWQWGSAIGLCERDTVACASINFGNPMTKEIVSGVKILGIESSCDETAGGGGGGRADNFVERGGFAD